MYKGQTISVVIPALNEQDAIGIVIEHLFAITTNNTKVIDSIVVCNNGSTDNTAQVAHKAGAIVVEQTTPGYGIACLTAIDALPTCDIVLFVDGDDSCYPHQAITLLDGIIDKGDDLAIGSRTLGNIEKGALTPPQLFGNWLASKLIGVFWQQDMTDLGPFRAISFDALVKLSMKDKTFGWTVEMQVKAIIQHMQVNEYPVDSKIRIGQSKISGTVMGTIKAGIGILSMIAKLRFCSNKKRVLDNA